MQIHRGIENSCQESSLCLGSLQPRGRFWIVNFSIGRAENNKPFVALPYHGAYRNLENIAWIYC